MINEGLRELKEKIKDMSEEEKEIKNPNEIVILLKRSLGLIDKTKKDKY